MVLPQGLCFGPYRLTGPQGQLWYRQTVLALPPKAVAVLWCLATRAGQLVSKDTLLETVWAETVVSEGVLAAQETAWVGWGQCVEAYGPGTGYLPVLEALGRLCRGPAGATVLAQLRQWAPTWLAQLAGVLPEDEQVRLQRRTRGTTRECMLRSWPRRWRR
jgi:hypothetical protein